MLDQIFTYTDADLSLSEADEAALIVRAQEGDDEATLTLLAAYGPALRSAVGKFTTRHADTPAAIPVEDLQSEALAAFLTAVREHDAAVSPRLAGHLPVRLRRALSDFVTSLAPFAIPDRTLSRFYGILRGVEGDVEQAREQAPSFGMSRETFDDVLNAVRISYGDDTAETGQSRVSRTPSASEDGSLASEQIWDVNGAGLVGSFVEVVDVEDKILCDLAFSAVSDEEARICELAYGFTEYDPVPDAEIAHRMGLTRPTVQRKRGKALGVMRKAIGVTHD